MEEHNLKEKSSSIAKIFVIFHILGSAIFVQNTCTHSKEHFAENYRCQAEQWAIDTSNYYAYRHDCLPFHSEHFTVFSDGSSWESKQQLANIAEEIFYQLVPEFLINSIERELQFIEGYTYYIYAEKYIDSVAMGFRNGFYIAAIDSDRIPDVYSRDPGQYRYVVKHELTHVFQFTLTDCPSNQACPYWLGVWFREGQAIVMGGKGEEIRVKTTEALLEWVADSNRVNPISIHRSTDYPDTGGNYYPMFALAYTYLTDSRFGHGATISDMRYLFKLMKEGEPFEDAFEKALNMSVIFFHDHFYALMETYIRQTEMGPVSIQQFK